MRPRPSTGDQPVLDDGTSVGELIDLDTHGVSLRAYADPAVYRLELERIFARTWVAVAHESEIPDPGDFVTRYIGQDSVIVTRDRAGAIHIVLNVCSHRGMQVCRSELGNTPAFRCPYHGWVYGLDGALRGVPAEEEMYGDSLRWDEFGLMRARVDAYAGMVFGTWDPDAPSLVEYLGDYRWYLDVLFNRSDSGMEVVGPPQRWMVNANWKLASDQFCGDGYHAMTLHQSMQRIGMRASNEEYAGRGLDGINVNTPEGHALRCLDKRPLWARAAGSGGQDALTVHDKLRLQPPAGMNASMVDQVERNLKPEQVAVLVDTPPVVGLVFPNLAYLNRSHFDAGDGDEGSILTWRTWNPKGPGRTEIMSWALVERDAPPELKERTRRTTILTFSDSGVFEQDDAEAWAGIQNVAGGLMAQRRMVTFDALLGPNRPDGWPGGGSVHAGAAKDDNQWNFYVRWMQMLTGSE